MTLGRLERVDLRSVWEREDTGFTPWLAEPGNLQILSETLGTELELEAVEKDVGPFRADILCREQYAEDRWVLIENQLARTDHSHLGQLLTYASGLDAATIVWIAAPFADEHRKALDWLNEITDAAFKFFGLEIELYRIGDSVPAPRFNVIASPNNWSRQTTAAKRVVADNLSPTRLLQRRYWEAVQARISNQDCPMSPVKPLAQSWLWHGIGKTGVALGLAVNMRDKWVRAEIYFSGKRAKADFSHIETKREEIDSALAGIADWQELPDKNDCRICIKLDADPADEASWPDQHEWLISTASDMHRIFAPHVGRLPRGPMEESSE